MCAVYDVGFVFDGDSQLYASSSTVTKCFKADTSALARGSEAVESLLGVDSIFSPSFSLGRVISGGPFGHLMVGGNLVFFRWRGI